MSDLVGDLLLEDGGRLLLEDGAALNLELDATAALPGQILLSGTFLTTVPLAGSYQTTIPLDGGGIVTTENQDFEIWQGGAYTLVVTVPGVDLNTASAISWKAAPGGRDKDEVTKTLAAGTITVQSSTVMHIAIAATDFVGKVVGKAPHECLVTIGGAPHPAMTGQVDVHRGLH